MIPNKTGAAKLKDIQHSSTFIERDRSLTRQFNQPNLCVYNMCELHVRNSCVVRRHFSVIQFHINESSTSTVCFAIGELDGRSCVVGQHFSSHSYPREQTPSKDLSSANNEQQNINSPGTTRIHKRDPRLHACLQCVPP